MHNEIPEFERDFNTVLSKSYRGYYLLMVEIINMTIYQQDVIMSVEMC